MSASLDLHRREAARLAELERLGAVGSEADGVLRELVDDAREAFGTELCMANLITSDVQYFTAWSGDLPPELAEAGQDPRERSMCRYVVETERPFVVEDLLATERFKDQHFRVRYGVRFYAGTPLITADGHAIGSLCLLDTRPREFGERDLATLRAFAKAVVGRLEALAATARERDAKESERQYRRNVFELANDAILIFDPEAGTILDANERACETYRLPRERLVGEDVEALSLDPERDRRYVRELLGRGSCRDYETGHRRGDGTPMDASINSSIIEYGGRRAVLSINRDITERKRAEGLLRERSATITASIDGMATLDGSGVYTYMNDAHARIYGYDDPEELLGKSWDVLYDEEQLRWFERHTMPALGRDGYWRGEATGKKRDGSRFPQELSITTVEGGGFVCVVRDITERKRAELALEESEQRFRQLFEQGVDTLLMHDEEGRILDCNAEACRSLGYSREEMLSLNVRDFAANLASGEGRVSEGGALWRDAAARKIGTPASGFHLAEHRRKDGTTFPVEVRVGRIDHGGRRMMLASCRDVTELKQAAEALRESEERYRSVVENVKEAIFQTDAEGRWTFLNPAWEEMTGFPVEESLGENFLDYVHHEDRSRNLEEFRPLVEGEKDHCRHEVRYLTKGGGFRWVEVYARLTLAPDGAVLGTSGTLNDVTDRKRAEEELRRSEARSRAILDAIPDSMFLYGRDGEYLDVQANKAGKLYLPREELIGRKLGDVLPPGVAQPFLQEIARALDTRETQTYEYRLEVPEGVLDFEAHLAASGPGEVLCVARDVTERKRAERRLREAEEKYRTLVERIPAVIYTQELEHNNAVSYIGPQIEDLLGYPAQEYASAPERWLEQIHPDDRERVLAEDERTDETGEPFRMEYRKIARDGRVVWVRDEAVLVEDSAGRPRFWQGVMADVTERKEAEERLRFQAQLLDAVGQAVVATDLEGRIVYWNRAAEGLYGWAADEAVGRPAHEVMVSEDQLERAAEIWAELAAGRSWSGEFVVRRRDGTLLPVMVTDTSVFDERGNLVGIIGVSADITDRKRAEAALRESEERFRAAFENAPTGVALVGLDNRYLRTNRALCEMLGYEEGELLGKSTFELTHPEDLAKSRARTERMLGEDEPESGNLEKRYVRRDGSVMWALSSVSLITDSAGNPEHFVSQFQDVTERKRAEAALSESEAKLARAQRIAHLGSWEIDLVAGKMSWSDELYRIFGFAPGEVTPTRELLTAATHPQDRESVPEAIRDAVERRQPFDFEHRVLRPDGEVRVVHAQGEAVFDDPDGRPVKLLGTSLDITERKRVQEALHASEARLRTVIQQSPLGIHIFAPDGTSLLANDAWNELWYLEEGEQPEGTNVFEDEQLRAAGLLGHVERSVEGAVAVETPPLLFDPASAGREGDSRWLEALIYPVRDEEGRLREVALLLEDVTERERAEKKLREAEERYRTLVERIPAVTYVQEATGAKAVTYVSPQVETMLGYAPEECTSDPDHWVKILHPDDKERVLAEDERTYENGAVLCRVPAVRQGRPRGVAQGRGDAGAGRGGQAELLAGRPNRYNGAQAGGGGAQRERGTVSKAGRRGL